PATSGPSSVDPLLQQIAQGGTRSEIDAGQRAATSERGEGRGLTRRRRSVQSLAEHILDERAQRAPGTSGLSLRPAEQLVVDRHGRAHVSIMVLPADAKVRVPPSPQSPTSA